VVCDTELGRHMENLRSPHAEGNTAEVTSGLAMGLGWHIGLRSERSSATTADADAANVNRQ
jgi:hypothetical protein